MKPTHAPARRLFLLALFLTGLTAIIHAEPSATAKTDLTDNQGDNTIGVGGVVTYTITVRGAKVDKIDLPNVDGLTLSGNGTNPQPGHEDFTFFLTPNHPGDYTIPAFDFKTADGQTLHVNAVKFHAKPMQQ